MSRPLAVTILGAFDPASPTAGLAQGLAARGHNVRMITPGYGSSPAGGGLTGVGARRLIRGAGLGVRFVVARWGRPDVVLLVSSDLVAAGLASVRARLARRPVGVWAHELASLATRSPSAVARAVESTMLGSAQGVVLVHERLRDAAVSALGVPPERVEVIRDWSRLPPAPRVDRAAVRGRLGWPLDETVVLHTGAIGARQALDNVVEAARLADEHQAPVRFVLVGEGDERERLRAAAGDTRSLQFLDPLPEAELLQALAAADIMLVHEQAGLRALSAPGELTTYFAAGRPVLVVADATSVAAGEVRAAGAGVCVEAGSPRHVLRATIALGADPARCRALGVSGRQYCAAHLSEQAALDHFEHWLYGVAGVPAPVEYADAT